MKAWSIRPCWHGWHVYTPLGHLGILCRWRGWVGGWSASWCRPFWYLNLWLVGLTNSEG